MSEFLVRGFDLTLHDLLLSAQENIHLFQICTRHNSFHVFIFLPENTICGRKMWKVLDPSASHLFPELIFFHLKPHVIQTGIEHAQRLLWQQTGEKIKVHRAFKKDPSSYSPRIERKKKFWYDSFSHCQPLSHRQNQNSLNWSYFAVPEEDFFFGIQFQTLRSITSNFYAFKIELSC